ncbi:hypothetical protein HYALB_00004197 [Hymenoscyphus albidus]|uniref:C3H1-type domain-containing protein n=1 Tax=Hymenoscyphus albidus TaxID=595503 RepID=A0A9N9LZZ9_9HELO|nr:hypothetical protein HYALB_00004197 [Hymenoscyphus albidus]
MASEDQDILARISQLAGKINRHKNDQTPDSPGRPMLPQRSNRYLSENLALRIAITTTDKARGYPQANTGWRPGRGGHSSRGYRGGKPPAVHRNRTLVLNSGSSTPPTLEANDMDIQNAASFTSNTASTGPSWVTKQDRHLQLINTSIFEKDSQVRAKAMEETRKQKIMERDAREKAKLSRHLHRVAAGPHSGAGAYPRSASAPSTYEINIQGIQFRVAKNGSKLLKTPGERLPSVMAYRGDKFSVPVWSLPCEGDLNAAKATPKSAFVGGVKFHRSKNGNMYRSAIIKAHRRTAVVKKINEPCKMFTTTGSCSKGPRCRYNHDPSKTAVCKEILLKGVCPSGEACDLSHELTPERTPACLHFAKGNCSNPNCRYTHVRVSPNAHVCRSFGIYGYCDKGTGCEERHVHECPDFSNTGTCTTKGCKLPHRYKASVMRGNTNRGEASGEDGSSDLSSDDDEDAIDSDDVDSDEFEEFWGDEDGPDVDAMQQDYVQLA